MCVCVCVCVCMRACVAIVHGLRGSLLYAIQRFKIVAQPGMQDAAWCNETPFMHQEVPKGCLDHASATRAKRAFQHQLG